MGIPKSTKLDSTTGRLVYPTGLQLGGTKERITIIGEKIKEKIEFARQAFQFIDKLKNNFFPIF